MILCQITKFGLYNTFNYYEFLYKKFNIKKLIFAFIIKNIKNIIKYNTIFTIR